MRLGVFGGTFDPIHLGHLAVAEEARRRLGLEQVLFLPAGAPPHKGGVAVAPAADRLEMVRLAVAGNPAFVADDREIRRPGPSFTVDTLEELGREHPGAELYYLLGSDSVVELDSWHEPSRLFGLAIFAVLLRPGWSERRVRAWWRAHPAEDRPRLQILGVPGMEVASRDLRRLLAAGEVPRYLLPEEVRGWITTRGLYREGGAAPAAAWPSPQELRQELRTRLSAPRAAHVERVAATARELAVRHHLEPELAELAGLLHDWFRELPAAEIVRLAGACGVLPAGGPADLVPSALHGPVAARLLPARWPGVPAEVWLAVDRHTTGDPQMTAFDCLLFVADMVEPGHSFPGVAELRAAAGRDLWVAARQGMDLTLARLLAAGRSVDGRTVRARNALLARERSLAAPGPS